MSENFDIKVQVQPGQTPQTIDQIESKLAKLEKQAADAAREMKEGMASAAKAFGPLAQAIEMESRMLERATGKSKDYGFQLAALQKLHNDGRISAEQYIKTLEKMG